MGHSAFRSGISSAALKMTTKIPFTVIGGFLGAGKTTLLNNWLRDLNGARVALLVNDFGELNIDASLIAGNHGDTIALTNGCVCCNLGDDLTQSLIKVLDKQPPFDAVIVEASGVSDPGRIAVMAQAAPELQRDAVLVMVDSSMLLKQWQDPLLVDTLKRQLHSADILVLNKIDLVDTKAIAQIMDHLNIHASEIPIVKAVEGRVPASILTGLKLTDFQHSCCDQSPDHEANHFHEDSNNLHGNQFETWSAHPSQIWTLQQWETAFKVLDGSVLRMKGLVRSQEYDWTEVQWAGRRLHLKRAAQSPADGKATLVAIGLRSRLPHHILNECLKT